MSKAVFPLRFCEVLCRFLSWKLDIVLQVIWTSWCLGWGFLVVFLSQRWEYLISWIRILTSGKRSLCGVSGRVCSLPSDLSTFAPSFWECRCSAAFHFWQQDGRRHYTSFPRNPTTAALLLKVLFAINIGPGLIGLCWGSAITADVTFFLTSCQEWDAGTQAGVLRCRC